MTNEHAASNSVARLLLIVLGLMVLHDLVFVFLVFFPNGSLEHQPGEYFSDFMVFYASGPALKSGGNSLLFSPAQFTDFQNTLFKDFLPAPMLGRPWLYPPPALAVTAMLSALPFFTSALVFQSLGVIALWLGFGRSMTSTFVTLISPAFTWCFVSGQSSGMLAASLIGGVRLLEASPRLSGVMFGLLVLKPHLFLLIPVALLASRAWTAMASCMLTAAVIAAGSLWYPGLDAWRFWLEAATGPAQVLSDVVLQRNGLVMGSTQAAVRIAGGGHALATFAQVLSASLAALAVGFTFRATADARLRALVLSYSALLAAPYWMNYDLLIPAAALAFSWSAFPRLDPRDGEGIAWVLLWTLPITIRVVNGAGLPVAPLVLLVMLVLALQRVRATLPTAQISVPSIASIGHG